MCVGWSLQIAHFFNPVNIWKFWCMFFVVHHFSVAFLYRINNLLRWDSMGTFFPYALMHRNRSMRFVIICAQIFRCNFYMELQCASDDWILGSYDKDFDFTKCNFFNFSNFWMKWNKPKSTFVGYLFKCSQKSVLNGVFETQIPLSEKWKIHSTIVECVIGAPVSFQ